MQRIQHHFSTGVRIALVILLVLIAFLCALLLFEYQNLRQQEMIGAHMPWIPGRGKPAEPMTDVNFIQSWMTYDYIGHIYGLPMDYLKDTLSIADTQYPHISITESAEAQHESAAALTAQVQLAVSDYIVKNQR
jgi:hypothetical protein